MEVEVYNNEQYKNYFVNFYNFKQKFKPDDNIKRRRELLKNYYGMNNENEVKTEVKTKKASCDIDDPNFDSDIYLKTLLKVIF